MHLQFVCAETVMSRLAPYVGVSVGDRATLFEGGKKSGTLACLSAKL